jgi:hypothetical protein
MSTVVVHPLRSTTLEPFDFLARSVFAQFSQADIRRLALKYLLRHLLNRFFGKINEF